MKIFLSVCFLVCSMTLSAQVAEIFGGINKNEFYGNEGFSHFSADYTIEKTGYRIGLGMEGIILGPSTMRFTVSYDAYSGALHASDGALGAGHFTDVEIDKSIISIGVFPLNMKVADQLNLNLGCEFSRLINEHIKGTYTQWTLGQPNKVFDVEELYDRYSALYYIALAGGISYDISLSKSLAISPQYLFQLGLSREFREFPQVKKCMKHFLGIGIKRKFR